MPRKWIVAIMIVLAGLVLGLAWVDSGFASIQSWGSFSAIILLCSLVIFAGWHALKGEAIPGWIGWLTLGAVFVRLGVGVLWFIVLPELGYGTEGELAGYVMSDAYRRDTTAWELADSDKPLLTAFQDYRLADQYGGLLFLSAFVYRYLGGSIHHPLIIVVLAASFSAMAIMFGWVFTRRLWGKDAAKIAVWILFLYPDTVLMGSSQMREAFTMTLTGMALYGLVYYWQDRKWTGILWIVIAFLVGFPISNLFAIMLLGILITTVIVLNWTQSRRGWILFVVLGSMILGGILILGLFGEKIYPEGASNPLALIRQWLVFAARWEKRTAAISSGWIDKIFLRSPEWMHAWILLGYGVVQPFLPAAMIALGNWTWRIIAIWRAFGWTSLLVLLSYAPLRAAKSLQKDYLAAGISLLVWAGIILSAYRGGGDQWDNPRYRVVFIVLQAALAAWVWTQQRQNPDPWLKRVLVGIGCVFAWFIPWYLRRYSDTFTWPVVDLFKTLGLGFSTAALYWIWDWIRCFDVRRLDDSNG